MCLSVDSQGRWCWVLNRLPLDLGLLQRKLFQASLQNRKQFVFPAFSPSDEESYWLCDEMTRDSKLLRTDPFCCSIFPLKNKLHIHNDFFTVDDADCIETCTNSSANMIKSCWHCEFRHSEQQTLTKSLSWDSPLQAIYPGANWLQRLVQMWTF